MATQTTNLGLTKPGYDEAADIVPAVNNNMDAIDAVMGAVPPNTSVQAQITANAQAIAKLDESIAIVSNGNTHAAIAAGQYVYIKGHETLAEGLYTANSAISANATLSNSNVTAVSGGGLNALNSNLTNKIKRKTITVSCEASTWQYIPLSTLSQYGIDSAKIINIIPTFGQSRWVIWRMASSNVIFLKLNTNSTNIVVDDTAGDFSLDIIYTDNIASSN